MRKPCSVFLALDLLPPIWSTSPLTRCANERPHMHPVSHPHRAVSENRSHDNSYLQPVGTCAFPKGGGGYEVSDLEVTSVCVDMRVRISADPFLRAAAPAIFFPGVTR